MARSGRGLGARSALAALLITLGAAGAARAEVACGDTIFGRVALTANLACDVRSAPALTLAAGATLDMSGYVLSCMTGTQPAVQLAGDGATVRDGAVAGCHTGVLAAASKGRVENVVVHFFPATVYGIRVTGNQNVVKASAVNGAAVNPFVVEGDGNRVLHSVAGGGGEASFRVSGNGNTLADNLAYFSNFNGFLIGAGSNNKLLRNVAVIGEVGFAVHGAGNELDGNTAAAHNIVGFAVSYDATGTMLRRNSSQFSKDGFDVVGSTTGLRRNRAYAHATNGITVSGSQCTIARNTSIGNQSLDMSELAGCQNHWVGNAFGFRNNPCIE